MKMWHVNYWNFHGKTIYIVAESDLYAALPVQNRLFHLRPGIRIKCDQEYGHAATRVETKQTIQTNNCPVTLRANRKCMI